jgi:hypothetical protein
MGFFSKSLLLAAQQPTTAPSTSTATSTDTAAADSAAAAPAAPATGTYASQVRQRRQQADQDRYNALYTGPEGQSYGGMTPEFTPMPDVQQNEWWDPESGGMSEMDPTYAPGVWNPNESLAGNLGNAGLAGGNSGPDGSGGYRYGSMGGAGQMHPTFNSAIITAFGWRDLHSGNPYVGDYGSQEAFDLIMSADPVRANADPLGYANELLVEAGIIPRGFKDANELSAVNMSLPGHNSNDWAWMEPVVMGGLAAISGGALGPAMGGMLGSTMGPMAAGGLTSGLMTGMQGGSFEDMLRSGAIGGLSAGIAPGLRGIGLGGTDVMSQMARAGITGAGAGMLSGQDFDDSLRQGLTSAGTAGAIGYGTPIANDLAVGAQDWLANAEVDPLAGMEGFDVGEGMPGDSLAEYGVQRGMLPVRSTIGGTTTDPLTGLTSSSPAMTTFESADGNIAEAPATTAYESLYPQEAAALSALQASQLTPEEEAADAENKEALEEGDALTNEPEALVTEQDMAKYLKVAKTVYEMFGEGSGPQRQEGQTDEQYVEELAQYIEVDLSPEAMAELGLEPGTDAYYQYIMDQADAIIEATVGGLEGEELSAALRNMTEEEIAKLQRALYVRGQMDSMVQAGSTQIDPVTGEAVQVGVEGGEMVNTGEAAYQSGLAQDVMGLEDMDDIYALLGRNFDPYGMQRSADARMKLARDTETQDEEMRLRRRGMLS